VPVKENYQFWNIWSRRSARMRSLAVILLLFSSGFVAKSRGLECYDGACGMGTAFGLNGPCSDDAYPRLKNIACPTVATKCVKMVGYDNSRLFRWFTCAAPEWNKFGIGCSDRTDEAKAHSHSDSFANVEVCLCDTPLCNAGSKKVFTTFLAVVLFSLSTLII